MDETFFSSQRWYGAFNSFRTDLQLTDDAIALFALQLKFSIEDIQTVASESLTGGGDDKKCDLLYLDTEQQLAVIAQAYISKKNKNSAPANKAADLNTAVGWLLSREIQDLPQALRGRAVELREAIKDGLVKQVHIWYVHNLPQSKNVQDELRTVSHTARSALESSFAIKDIPIFSEEIGSKRISELYDEAERTINVVDKISITSHDAFEVTGDKWRALMTTVTGAWLHDLYKRYHVNLFSANVRDYLGSRASDSNINNGIKQSAEKAPGDFWVYNNGITALVNDYTVGNKTRSGVKIEIHGISIVNGAQTTGSIGSMDVAPDASIRLPIRLVKTNDSNLVERIVRFNNSQNKVQAADFRSTDSIQTRLRQEFERVPSVDYDGGRRGGASDAMKRRKNLLPSYTVGQALAAFHGDPVTAYDKKTDIWANEGIYLKYFNEKTSARHVIFCFGLLDNISKKRLILLEKQRKDANGLTQQEKSQLEFLNKKGSAYLLVYTISQSLEIVIGRVITNRFEVRYKENYTAEQSSQAWNTIVDIFISLGAQLDGAFSRNRISNEKLRPTVVAFSGIVQSLAGGYRAIFDPFSALVELE
ncbi:AIPR family protein [Methylobacterium brachiatum]